MGLFKKKKPDKEEDPAPSDPEKGPHLPGQEENPLLSLFNTPGGLQALSSNLANFSGGSLMGGGSPPVDPTFQGPSSLTTGGGMDIASNGMGAGGLGGNAAGGGLLGGPNKSKGLLSLFGLG